MAQSALAEQFPDAGIDQLVTAALEGNVSALRMFEDAGLHLVAELWFDDADGLKAALRSPEMAATAADARTFDVASMTMFTGEVVEVAG